MAASTSTLTMNINEIRTNDTLRIEYKLGGVLHREEEPAVIVCSINHQDPCWEQKREEWWIQKEWWTDGKLHRVEGPAVIKRHLFNPDAFYYEEWRLHGELHRPCKLGTDSKPTLSLSNPAVVHCEEYHDDDQTMYRRTEEFWVDGARMIGLPNVIQTVYNRHHHCSNDCSNDDDCKHSFQDELYYVQYEWKVDQMYHRTDGPAFIREYSECRTDGVKRKWYVDGLLHRVDGPAIDGKNKKWYFKGELHRENDEPAVIRNDGIQTMKQWWKNGKLHRDNDKPAIIKELDDQIIYSAWYMDGELHREPDCNCKMGSDAHNMDCKFNPAVIIRDSISLEFADEYWWHGKLHRMEYHSIGFMKETLPARKVVNSTDSRTEWYVNGKLHRDDGPAVVIKSTRKHGIRSSTWYQNGVIHRTDEPAHIVYDSDGNHQSLAWYDQGECYMVNNCQFVAYSSVASSSGQVAKASSSTYEPDLMEC